MIQIKKFKKNTTDKVINDFLAENLNCNILETNPYTIQYEVVDNYIKPIVIEGLPVSLYLTICDEFEEVVETVEFNCSQLLIFDEYILFRKNSKRYLKVNIKEFYLLVNYYFPEKGIENNIVTEYQNTSVLSLTVGDYTFSNTRDFNIKYLVDTLLDLGMAYVDSNLSYQERTNTLIDSAHLRGEYNIKSSNIIKDGLNNVAKATLASGAIQAESARKIHNGNMDNKLI